MGILLLILQAIVALPKIFSTLISIRDAVEKANEARKDQKHQDAKTELDHAKTKKEVEDAANKYLNS